MPDFATLLPHNASPFERALEQATARIEVVPVLVATLWNPDTCPAHLLGWLAWAMSVDVWQDDWSDEIKRDVIRQSPIIHRHKGTVGSVRRALDALGIDIEITEWWEDDSPPYTFKIDCKVQDLIAKRLPVNRGLFDVVSKQIDQVKPVRAHYSLRVGETMTAIQKVRSGFAATIVDHFSHDFYASEPV